MGRFDPVAEQILEARYLRRDEMGQLVETPEDMFRRVAADLAAAERAWGKDPAPLEAQFYRVMADLDFLPNSPTLMNAGTDLQQLAACFVLPIEDSLESIFETVKHAALIHQSGGGTGFSFSRLRPAGDVVRSTGGVASGPVSFMRVFDAATEQIKQGGRRRGANMGVLSVDHPDVEAFVESKRETDVLRNFNLSVATTDAFWDALDAGESFESVNPRTGAVLGTRSAADVLEAIATAAWETGEPGILFLDRINEASPFEAEPGQEHWIEATNPCGELPLEAYEACILGSVNLGTHTADGEIDWEKLEQTVRTGIRLLDDAIERSQFPLPAIEARVLANRKLGLGVMGFHDMLVDLGVPYESAAAIETAEAVMEFIDAVALEASRDLAAERGPFPAWEESVYTEPVRNATRTAIAPTGTISMIAGASAAIEPVYNVVYTKRVLGGLRVVNDRFVRVATARGFYSAELVEALEERTSLRGLEQIPEDVAELFQTAHDVSPEHHVRIQAAFQAHVDNAVSKTVNLRRDATVADVESVFRLARDLDCKGITVFRSGSRREGVLGSDPLKEECIGECDYVGSAN